MNIIGEVKKPVEKVARQILSYVDPESQMKIFKLIGFNLDPDQPLLNIPSLDNPDSLKGDEYLVVHKYHSDDCVITDPADPRYLNASAMIADISKNWNSPDETRVRWKPEHMQHPQLGVGYERLERLLQE